MARKLRLTQKIFKRKGKTIREQETLFFDLWSCVLGIKVAEDNSTNLMISFCHQTGIKAEKIVLKECIPAMLCTKWTSEIYFISCIHLLEQKSCIIRTLYWNNAKYTVGLVDIFRSRILNFYRNILLWQSESETKEKWFLPGSLLWPPNPFQPAPVQKSQQLQLWFLLPAVPLPTMLWPLFLFLTV